MGYTTDFDGQFDLDKPLSAAQVAYLEKFANTRRITRDAEETAKFPDPLRDAVGLPIGKDACFYVGSTAPMGQDWKGGGVVDGNRPPEGQPGLWCKWVPTEDGTAIVWNEHEKFYDYVGWLQYLIKNFLKPWGYTLSGKVRYQGEEYDDRGAIYVKDNKVQQVPDKISEEEPDFDDVENEGAEG